MCEFGGFAGEVESTGTVCVCVCVCVCMYICWHTCFSKCDTEDLSVCMCVYVRFFGITSAKEFSPILADLQGRLRAQVQCVCVCVCV